MIINQCVVLDRYTASVKQYVLLDRYEVTVDQGYREHSHHRSAEEDCGGQHAVSFAHLSWDSVGKHTGRCELSKQGRWPLKAKSCWLWQRCGNSVAAEPERRTQCGRATTPEHLSGQSKLYRRLHVGWGCHTNETRWIRASENSFWKGPRDGA